MPRPRTFTEDEALQKAMNVFWTKGYEGTSLDDLLGAMGIQRGSFYNAFHSKRDVYLRVLRAYERKIATRGPIIDLPAEATRESLRDFFRRGLAMMRNPEGPGGCFLAKAASEHEGRDPDVSREVAAGCVASQRHFQDLIERARASGSLEDGPPAEDLAMLMIVLGYGFQVLTKSDLTDERLLGAADAFVDLLAGGGSQEEKK